jgi:hypothetical protein
MGMIRLSAGLTVFGVVLNRLNTAIIAFNWKLPYREIPHWREVIISLTIFCIYITVYRFILYRLPILYQWKSVEEPATVMVPSAVAEPAYSGGTLGGEAMPVATYRTSEAEEY